MPRAVNGDRAVTGADAKFEGLVVVAGTGVGREIGAHDAVLRRRIEPDGRAANELGRVESEAFEGIWTEE